MAITIAAIRNSNGVTYTRVTDSSADWASVPSSTYFKDLSDGLVRFKDSTGTVRELFPSSGVTVGTTAITSGTDGRVFFQAGGVIQQDGAFNWDNTNKRLGIGSTPSTSRLNVLSTNNTDADMQIRIGSTDGTTRFYTIGRESANGQLAFRWGGEAGALGAQFYFPVTTFNTITSSSSDQGTARLRVSNTGGGRTFALIAGVHNSSQSNFSLYDETAGITRFILDGSGNLGLGTGTTAPGARLDVRAQGALSTDIAFRVRNSADSANIAAVQGNGNVLFNNTTHGLLFNSQTVGVNQLELYSYGVTSVIISPVVSRFAFTGLTPVKGVVIGNSSTTPAALLDVWDFAGPGPGTTVARFGSQFNSTGADNLNILFSSRYSGFTAGSAHMAKLNIGQTGSGASLNARSYFKFELIRGNTLAEIASITSQSNLLLQTPTEDTNDVGVIYIPNGTAPTVALAGGGKLYVEGGALRYLDVNGTVTNAGGTVQSVVSAATVTPVYTNKFVKVTAQAAALTLANPTGTWAEGQDLMIRIKDDGLSAQTITWDTNYRAIGVTLPTTTVISKTTYVGVIYNLTDGKWDVIGVTTQA